MPPLIPASIGARLRQWIDRDRQLYQDIYQQRTATGRINSQAKALGIERPHLRNRQAITNCNTLIYILINLRAHPLTTNLSRLYILSDG